MRYASVQDGISRRPALQVRPVEMGDVQALAELEIAAFPPAMRASEAVIRRRLELGHMMVVADAGSHLAAVVSVVPTRESPFDAARFPRNFEQFSTLPRSEPVNSVYAYNLCVHPAHRGDTAARDVIALGIKLVRREGARWLAGDGRCPSYCGSSDNGTDGIRADPEFHAALDSWTATGERPPLQTLIRDPFLRFYYRLLDCEFLYLLRDFLPQDTSSGGHHVIFVKDLSV
jgi:hypothetical protein